jgi:hypothetical protein
MAFEFGGFVDQRQQQQQPWVSRRLTLEDLMNGNYQNGDAFVQDFQKRFADKLQKYKQRRSFWDKINPFSSDQG